MAFSEWVSVLNSPCNPLQVIKYGEPLDELQRDELRTAVEKLRRQMLRKSREYDCQILAERMELLHQAHQVCVCVRAHARVCVHAHTCA